MTGQVLYVGKNSDLVQNTRHDFEGGGYELVHASELDDAVQILEGFPVEVLCIDSRLLANEFRREMAARLKKGSACSAIVLTQGQSDVPEGFAELVDVVMDERDFFTRGRDVVDRLRELRFPEFVEWLDEWKQRCS